MANNRNELNKNLAQMLKGGVIMDVTTRKEQKCTTLPGRTRSICTVIIMPPRQFSIG